MNVHADERTNKAAMANIAAMLIALAVLAERASTRSLPVRFLVLWILRPAEAFARDFVADVTQTTHQSFAVLSPFENSSHDAIRLALSFRAMAAVLQHVSRQPCRFTMSAGGMPGICLRPPILRIGAVATALAELGGVVRCRLAPHDTS